MSLRNEAKEMTNKNKKGEIIHYLKMNYRGLYQINKMVIETKTNKGMSPK